MQSQTVPTSKKPRTEQFIPRLIFWEVTKGCNLRCVHCRATATELSSPTDLPTSRGIEIIDQIAGFANPILVLSGGEPLYRSDIFDLATYATQKGLRVALATNGTLVTKDVAKKIVAAGVKRVSISLDGADALTHDSFRGIPGAFDAAIYGMLLWNASPADMQAVHAALVAGFANATLRPIVGRRFSLADAAKAHKAVMEPGAHGKIVVTM
jgi:MoaA/NifB/PqqE/SkfB family radical SAM enzyme